MMHYIASPAHIKSYALAFVFLSLAVLNDALASDETRAAMVRVERALVEAGYPAQGYSDLPAPAVELVDEIQGPNGELWGSYSVATGRITISRRAPEGCRRLILAHEVAHDVVARKQLHLSVPVSGVIAFMERVSLIAEAAADADQFAPNCTRTRGSL